MKRALLLGLSAALSAWGFAPERPDTLLLGAMRSELRRSMDSLQLKGEPRPYFMSYLLWDMQGYHVETSMGSVERDEPERTRMLDVDLRVGSYDQDQSQYAGGLVFGPQLQAPIPESDDTLLLRQALWTLTDARYKVAVEQLAQKKSFLANHHGLDVLPDWTRQKSLQQRDIDALTPPDTAAWINLCRRLSAEVGRHAWLAESRVAYQYYYVTFYYVDSQGASYIQSLQENTWLAALLCQASDGEPLWDYARLSSRVGWPGRGGTPPEAELRDTLTYLLHRLDGLRHVPAVNSYRGPVLFTRGAACEVIDQTLLQPQATLRAPLSENSEPAFLLGLLDRKYLPDNITVRDTPFLRSYRGKLLYGAYKFDQEGQPAANVLLVDRGRITDFYRGKTPILPGEMSDNGHWRYGGGFPGVVEVQVSGGLSEGKLLDSLRRMARDEGAPYGLRVSKVADQDAWKLLRHPLMRYLPYADPNTSRGAFVLPAPVEIDAVDTATGVCTPVRGLTFNALDSKSLRDIPAVGKAPYLLEPQASFSLLCPSLLFSLLDLRGQNQVQPSLPILH